MRVQWIQTFARNAASSYSLFISASNMGVVMHRTIGSMKRGSMWTETTTWSS